MTSQKKTPLIRLLVSELCVRFLHVGGLFCGLCCLFPVHYRALQSQSCGLIAISSAFQEAAPWIVSAAEWYPEWDNVDVSHVSGLFLTFVLRRGFKLRVEDIPQRTSFAEWSPRSPREEFLGSGFGTVHRGAYL